jgi:hypothetical protein
MIDEPKERKAFISYLDDNDRKVATYINLISKDSGVVIFRTHNNVITIPFTRILKLKEGADANGKQ